MKSRPLTAAQAVALISADERTGQHMPHRIAEGLYLTPQPRKDGVRWVALLRWTLNGKADNKVLGNYDRAQHGFFLALAVRAREALQQGLNPHTVLDAGDAVPGTYKEAAEAFINMKVMARVAEGGSTKNAKNIASCIRRRYKALGHLQLTAISPKDIQRALLADWNRTIPAARKALRRIAKVIDYGFALSQVYDRVNPADWKRAQSYMPDQDRHRTKHHLALEPAEVPAAFRELAAVSRNGYRGCGAAALRFLILTGARGNEVIRMEWEDIDWSAKKWVRPADKMKGRVQHEVPLSEPALIVLREQQRYARGPFVFPGQKTGTGLSENAIRGAMQRTTFGQQATPHGFRSSLAGWWRTAAVSAKFRKVILDDALAHVRREEDDESKGVDHVFRAYDRAKLFVERRAFMKQWAEFVTGMTENQPLTLVA
jgi:integrase